MVMEMKNTTVMAFGDAIHVHVPYMYVEYRMQSVHSASVNHFSSSPSFLTPTCTTGRLKI